MWLKEKECMDIIKANWHTEMYGSPFIMFHSKMKRLKAALTRWSEEHYGNIFPKIAALEEVIKVREKQFEDIPNGNNREALFKAQAELNIQ